MIGEHEANTACHGIAITQECIEEFLERQNRKMLAQGSLARYAFGLEQLRSYLGPGGIIQSGTLEKWKDALRQAGYSTNTINLNLSVANNLLSSLHRGDLRAEPLPPDAPPSPELSRNEYLRLLQTARMKEKERTYLLIKLFATTEIALRDLDILTVETVCSGCLPVGLGAGTEIVLLPAALQKELLGYTQRNGIQTGPVFRSRAGTVLSRSTVTTDMQRLAGEARVAPEKVNPRALKKLYQNTVKTIYRNLDQQARRAYGHLLDQEQQRIGWEKDSTDVDWKPAGQDSALK